MNVQACRELLLNPLGRQTQQSAHLPKARYKLLQLIKPLLQP